MVFLFKGGGYSLEKLDNCYILKYRVYDARFEMVIQKDHLPKLLEFLRKVRY